MRYTKSSFLKFFLAVLLIISALIVNALKSVYDKKVVNVDSDLSHTIVAKSVDFSRSSKDMVVYQGSAEKIIKKGDREIVYQMSLKKQDLNKYEILEAPKATNVDGKFIFEDGVHYSDSKGVKFFTQRGVYKQKDEILVGSGDFSLDSKEFVVRGDDVYYDSNLGVVKARNIEATIFRSKL